MMAGTKYRGELEEKLIKAMNFIKEKLSIDEIHNIVALVLWGSLILLIY